MEVNPAARYTGLVLHVEPDEMVYTLSREKKPA
jgi:hypothetical protein